MAAINANASKLAKNLTVTVTVTGMHWFRFRMQLGLLFVRLGVWITGMGIIVTKEKA